MSSLLSLPQRSRIVRTRALFGQGGDGDLASIWKRLLYALIVAVLVWLVKIVACRTAVRIHAGSGPAPVDPEEVGWRSALAAAGLTLLTPIEIYAWDAAFQSRLRDPVFWVI